MTVNLHAHTTRCSHATGEEREYIKRALQNGIKIFGFSDHAPFIFPNGYQSGYRVPMEQAHEYVQTLTALREEYRGRIDIRIGFEMEYYPLYFRDMLSIAREAGAEYLILGEHFLRNELPERKSASSLKNPITDVDLCDYVNDVCEGISTGAFTYVAHPDMIKYYGDEAFYLSEMSKICEASKKYDVPLELNFLGIRNARLYPRDIFWELVGKHGCSVVYGFDAHDVSAAYDGNSIKIAEEMRKKYNLNVIECPKIIDIQSTDFS